MQHEVNQTLETIQHSLPFMVPEFVLLLSILLFIITGLIRKNSTTLFHALALSVFLVNFVFLITNSEHYHLQISLFSGMLKHDAFGGYLKLLFNFSGILTVLLSWRNNTVKHLPEYYTLMLTIVLGAHLLVMSSHVVIVFLSIELISLCSYVLTAFSFSKEAAEGSLKYFIFGSIASAVMLYGFSLLYGVTGSLELTPIPGMNSVAAAQSSIFILGGLMAFAGFLFKVAAAPLHPWAPDVYEAAPMPIVAFFSVVPKLAGIGILTRFTFYLTATPMIFNWQYFIIIVIILTLLMGNFSALKQTRPKRMMAYSSIAQAGFLMAGLAAFTVTGIQFMLFYATIYLLMNYAIFAYLQYYEVHGIQTLSGFSGIGKKHIVSALVMLTAFVALTGLPPTAGFTAKLFVFSSVWQAYEITGKESLLWLLIFGLLNTVVSLFYYLRIPYYSLVQKGSPALPGKKLTFENLFGLILVLLLLILFFIPNLLMGWINKINFAF